MNEELRQRRLLLSRANEGRREEQRYLADLSEVFGPITRSDLLDYTETDAIQSLCFTLIEPPLEFQASSPVALRAQLEPLVSSYGDQIVVLVQERSYFCGAALVNLRKAIDGFESIAEKDGDELRLVSLTKDSYLDIFWDDEPEEGWIAEVSGKWKAAFR